jgi:hypothetical protein
MESNHHLKVRSFVYDPLYERGKTWQDYQGSNLERLSQSQLCYHYTIVQQNNLVPVGGNDPPTPALSRRCSTTELHRY